MTKLDYFWASQKEWWHRLPNGEKVLNYDAPAEAKESYERYLKQLDEATKRGSI